VLWKLYKKIARDEKIECFSPKSAFQAAFKLGLIDDEQLFIDVIDARSKTTHVYSESEAIKIYQFVIEKVVATFSISEKKLEEYLNP